MTRKDFVLIARTIKEMPVDERTRAIVATRFAAELRATNVQFNRDLFMAAATQ